MLLRFIRPLRFLARAFTDADSPRQLALGVALGLMVGLVPKGNLIAVVLTLVLLGTRVNLFTGLATALLFSWVGILVDPISHRLGWMLLTAEGLRPMWTFLYGLPLMPWTGFNNTVVLGAFVLGACAFYPVYRLSVPLFARYQPSLVERLRKLKLARILRGTDLAAGWRIG